MIINNINQVPLQSKPIAKPEAEVINKNDKDSVAFSSKEEVPFYKNSYALNITSTNEIKKTNSPEKLAGLAEETAIKTASDLVPSQGSVALRLLYTNDLHGAILPSDHDKKPGVQVGGLSMLSNLMNEKTIEGATLKLDGGDWAQGTYPSGVDQGATMMSLLGAIGFDATVIGNHDFDWGRENLNKIVDIAGFPALGANIVNEKDGSIMDGTKPYVIKNMNGVNVGIIGITSPITKEKTVAANTDGLKFEDPVVILKKYLPEMEKQNAEMIIAVSHCGEELDAEIAKDVPELDVIISAHTHRAFKEPIQVGKTLIVQAGSSARNLGALDINFDKEQDKIVNFKNDIIPVNSNTSKPDPKIEKLLSPVIDKLSKKMNESVGNSSVQLSHRGTNAETILGNIIADSMKKASGADVAFINEGGIRTGIKAGEITFSSIYQVMPNENEIITIDMTGSQLKGVMEESAKRERSTLDVSGMTMDIEPKNGKDERVMNVMVNGEPLDLGKTYRVAINDFLATGGSAYYNFTEGTNLKNEGIILRDAMQKHMTEIGTFTEANAKTEGRQNYLSPKPLERLD